MSPVLERPMDKKEDNILNPGCKPGFFVIMAVFRYYTNRLEHNKLQAWER
jgi:hypothetical protein